MSSISRTSYSKSLLKREILMIKKNNGRLINLLERNLTEIFYKFSLNLNVNIFSN